MPRFLTQTTSKRFEKTYRSLPDALKRQVDKTIRQLIEDPSHPGLNTHSIRDARYYWEAYINSGDRLIYRPEGTHLLLVNVVPHDRISRYAYAP